MKPMTYPVAALVGVTLFMLGFAAVGWWAFAFTPVIVAVMLVAIAVMDA